MKASKSGRISIIILTGLSGSGKTVALNAFEDSGFFCVDNLPISLIETFVNLCGRTPTISKIAIGVDVRERKFLGEFSHAIASIRKNRKLGIIFLKATDQVLVRRFKETRRPHPLGYKNLKQSLRKEAELLEPFREEADKIIDTSSLTPHELRKLIIESFLKARPKEMTINILSFGYKYGVPLDADLLFDVRFLPNPYFIDTLKKFPGTSPKVKKFVLTQDHTKTFFEKLNPLLNYLLPLYKKEGRSYLTIGIGCTGGMHRSPAIAEEIAKNLKKEKYRITVSHRDTKD